MAKLTTNWTNRDRTRFTNCKYTVLPQIGIKNKLGMCLSGGLGPYRDIFSEPFLSAHLSHSVEGDDHTKADAASVASNGADDENRQKSKRLLTTLTMGCFSELVTLLHLKHSPRCTAL